MKLYVNERNEIKDVNITTDASLTELEVADECNPFANWTTAKICCYRVEVQNGLVIMLTPYINSSFIEPINRSGLRTNELNDWVSDLLYQVCCMRLGIDITEEEVL